MQAVEPPFGRTIYRGGYFEECCLLGTKLLSRNLKLRPVLSGASRGGVCAQSTVKVLLENIELVSSNGRVTDNSSAETNLASHISSCVMYIDKLTWVVTCIENHECTKE